jgi:hypothetical protein
MIRPLALAAVMLVSVGVSNSFAWGCAGHQAIAIVAERLLPTVTLQAVNSVLRASPIDRSLDRYCGAEADLMADASTWADDERAVERSTAGWHFINLPRSLGATTIDYRRYCPNGNCVIDAIVAQYHTLTTSTDAGARANALRFIIHFVGDLHQPLHAITNGDRGGNCVAVALPGEPVRKLENHNVTPNLHGVWDTDLIVRFMKARRLRDARALASHIAMSAPNGPVTARAPTASQVSSWARASNELARDVAYGRLPVSVPMQPPNTITLSSCDDNNHIGQRMASLNETVTPAYEQASVSVIMKQMRLAGERLAAVLQAAFSQSRQAR